MMHWSEMLGGFVKVVERILMRMWGSDTVEVVGVLCKPHQKWMQ